MIPIVIGTRGSALAQAQTKLIRQALRNAWPSRTFEVHIVKTEGDQRSENPSASDTKLGKGLFTAELEQALFEKKIHIAVHSLKDLPTEGTSGLVLAAVAKRGDARDALITRGEKTLSELPPGAKVATGSPRRSAQLLLARPDLQIVDIRGNIDTRLRKFHETLEWSAIILAAAGLDRLQPDVAGMTITRIPLEIMLPAPGQGTLALQTRVDDKEVIKLLQALHDPNTWSEVKAERMFLQALGGGCQEPIGAYARKLEKGRLHLDGVAWLFGETKPRRGALLWKISEPERLGIDLAMEISR